MLEPLTLPLETLLLYGPFPSQPGANAYAILLAAVILDTLFGEMAWLSRYQPHPRRLLLALVTWFAPQLNQAGRGGKSARILRGGMLVFTLMLGAALVGVLIRLGTASLPGGWLVELWLLTVCFSHRRGLGRLAGIRRALSQKDEMEARRLLRGFVRRDVGRLDRHGLARAAVERSAWLFTAESVAPLFWYFLAGPAGLLASLAAEAAAQRLGFLSPQWEPIGLAARRMDAVLKLFPSRIAGIWVALAALYSPGSRPIQAWKIMLRDAGKHRQPGVSWPAGAIAGAHNLALGGPRRYVEEHIHESWIGDGRARLHPSDMRRAGFQLGVAALLNSLGLVALIAVWALFALRG